MRVASVSSPGAPFVITADHPVPLVRDGHVLVRIAASGVNPLDVKIRAGAAAHARQPLPAVLGLDFAGTVIEVGTGVTKFLVGDEVYGMAGGVGGLQGTLAEFGVFDAELLARKPANLSMREAAALPLAAITAWEGLMDRAQLQKGSTVLIHGGAGGVGNVAVQLAVAAGARVFSTASAANFDVLRAAGATPIDYHSQSVAAYVVQHTGGGSNSTAEGDGFDVVFDTVGGKVLDDSFLAVRRYTGRVVSALGWGTHSLAPLSFRGASYSGVFTLWPLLSGCLRGHHGAVLGKVAELVEAGKVTPRLDPTRFTLATVAEAHALVASGKSQGKVVVDIE